MTREQLIENLQKDLTNEYKHMRFYLLASVMVQGLHREELAEFFKKEAQSELEHCHEFAQLIVYLGAIPTQVMAPYPLELTDPLNILKYVREMEQEVADIYALRLRQTEDMENADTAYVHVFYEDQISDSQRTAWEVEQMIRGNS